MGGIATAFAGVVVAWAVFAEGGKVYAERYGMRTMTGVAITIGSLLYLPLGLWQSDPSAFSRISPSGWGSVADLVLLISIVACLIYCWAMKRADTSRVAGDSNLQPVFTAAPACAIHGEPITPSFLAGGAMVLAGVVLTERG